MPNLAVIGGGFCAVACANKLLELRTPLSVAIYSATPHFEYHGDLYKVLSGASAHLTNIPYKNLIDVKRVELILQSVSAISCDHKVVQTAQESKSYDFICLATGAQANFYNIPGLAEHAFTCRSTKAALTLHKKIVLAMHTEQKIEVVIAGAGPAGIEFAGYIAGLCLSAHRQYQITLIDAASQILPQLSDTERALVLSRLDELQIKLLTNVQIKEYAKPVLHTSNGEMPAPILIWCAGQQAQLLQTSDSQLSLSNRHAYLVDESLQTSNPDILAGGDCSSAPDAGLAWSALAHGEHIARTIDAKVRGHDLPKYLPEPVPFALPIGPHWALVKYHDQTWTDFSGSLQLKKFKFDLLQRIVKKSD